MIGQIKLVNLPQSFDEEVIDIHPNRPSPHGLGIKIGGIAQALDGNDAARLELPGGGLERIALDTIGLAEDERDERLLALDSVLDRLEEIEDSLSSLGPDERAQLFSDVETEVASLGSGVAVEEVVAEVLAGAADAAPIGAPARRG